MVGYCVDTTVCWLPVLSSRRGLVPPRVSPSDVASACHGALEFVYFAPCRGLGLSLDLKYGAADWTATLLLTMGRILKEHARIEV